MRSIINSETGAIYKSVAEVAKTYGGNISDICAVLNGRKHLSKYQHLKYENDQPQCHKNEFPKLNKSQWIEFYYALPKSKRRVVDGFVEIAQRFRIHKGKPYREAINNLKEYICDNLEYLKGISSNG